MTLPTISPVILFAVVIGVIQGLQYFTQAYVAANIASGQASQAGDVTRQPRLPEDSTLFYPILLYQNGFTYFQMGYASAMAILLLVVSLAVTLLIVFNSRRWVHYQGGATMTAASPPRRPRRAAAGRRAPPALPARRWRTTPPDRAPRSFLAPFVFIALTALMTTTRRSRRISGHTRSQWRNFVDVFTTAPIWRWTLNTLDVLGAGDARRCSSRASPSPTRSRGCAGGGATPFS